QELSNSFPGMLQLFFLLLFLAVFVFFCLNLQRAFEAVSPHNRKMPASNVWLLFIPLFNFYWQFVVINRLSESLGLEYDRLNLQKPELYPTRSVGIAAAIIYFITFIPFIKGLAAIAWLICFIVYWVKVYRSRKLILANADNFMLDAERELQNNN
ncbi:MAG: hypothetical protein KA160_01885, partial [Lacibacter sp.]|nr:hypothetical protein [Lacibacter sp.]